MKYRASIRDKLVGIFVLIKVIPLIVLAWFAWNEIFSLSATLETHVNEMAITSEKTTKQIADLAISSSIRALDLRSREAIERLTTDTAQSVALFLNGRDNDIQMASMLQPDKKRYQAFLDTHKKDITRHRPWVLNEDKDVWEPRYQTQDQGSVISAKNKDNELDFHSQSPLNTGIVQASPMYLEMTYVDISGKERIKVTSSDLLSDQLRDVSKKEETFCKAETYFDKLKDLKPDEIYVSDVIGAYVKTHMIGPYKKKRAKKMGIDFDPKQSGYAGKENPVGKKFQGLIRWAMPVTIDGKIKGYVTLALDHTHVMEYTDHIVPTNERYSAISDASSGNYAFMWDYKDRNISHPRDYFIVGYDPVTGEPAVPWLEDADYKKLMKSGQGNQAFLDSLPLFENQALSKSPSKELIKKGLVALDCRYLNFAPQCEGWNNLTQSGGSGSFVIQWSGLKKLTTAAAIPYFTGQYGKTPRGFGFITIGANVDEFHKPANRTAKIIKASETKYIKTIEGQSKKNKNTIVRSLHNTATRLTLYTSIMIILVIIVAVWMASVLTKKITTMIGGISRFQRGDRKYRLDIQSSDEMGRLGQTFNTMADSIQEAMGKLEKSKSTAENSNVSLRAMLSKIIDSMPSAIIGIDTRIKITLWNNEARKITGQTFEEVKGKNLFEVFPLLKKEKSIVFPAIKKGQIKKEERLEIIRNKERRLYDVVVYPLKDVQIDGAVLRIDNITTRVQMEEAMLQSEKMLSVGGLAAGMAHEINNPLAGMMQNAQLVINRLTKSFPANEKAALESGTTIPAINAYIEKRKVVQLLDNIQSAGRNAAKIVENMLSFAKKGDATKSSHNAAELFKSTLELAESDYDLKKKYDFKKIKIINRFESGFFEIFCEKSKILQVFFNIIKNAAEVMHDAAQKPEGPVLIFRLSKSNELAQIEIEDNGPGMDEKTRKRVFEPFFTTKEVDKGTGLGLSLSYFIIVDDHGGEMTVESTPGKGTKFIIRLPLSS